MEKSNAVQLAKDVLDAVKHHKGELTADGCRQAVGKRYFNLSGLDSGGYHCSPRGVKLAPKGEEFMDFTWAKFIKFCRENGLIEEESIKCNHKPAQSAAAAATMAAPAVTPAAETSTTLESAADAAASTLKPSSPDARTPLSAPASPADAGAAAHSLSAAAAVSSEVQPLASSAFDFGADAETNAMLLQDAQIFMAGSMARVMAAKRAHDRTAHNYRGSWGKWCELVGISRDTGDNMVRVAEQFGNIQIDGQNLIDLQPMKLLYAASRPSTPPEARAKVENLEITNSKQFQELLAQLKAKEQELADKQAGWEADRAATSALLADEQQRRQEANEARIAAEKASLEAKESCRAAQDAAKAARQDAEAKAARIAELEARPIEVVGADPDEIERRANALAEEKTADLKVELSAEKARASQLEEQLEDVKEMAEQSSAAFAIGMARRISDSCEEMLARHFADLARVDYDTYEQATDLLRELGDKLSYAIENGGWPDQWPIEYEEGPDE